MLLYSALSFYSKVNTQCFKVVHCKIMAGGTHSKRKRIKRYMMSQLAKLVKEEKKISPKLSHFLRIYSLEACRPDVSAESSQEMKNKNCKLDETKEKAMEKTIL